jgi:hypothetical protein
LGLRNGKGNLAWAGRWGKPEKGENLKPERGEGRLENLKVRKT